MKQTGEKEFENDWKAQKWKRSCDDYDVFRKKRDEHQSLKSFGVEKKYDWNGKLGGLQQLVEWAATMRADETMGWDKP